MRKTICLLGKISCGRLLRNNITIKMQLNVMMFIGQAAIMFPDRMFQQRYVPTAVCSHSRMFQRPYVPTAACSNGRMFQRPHVPMAACSNGRMFQRPHVPTAACSNGRMFQRPHVPTAACSNGRMFPGLKPGAIIKTLLTERYATLIDGRHPAPLGAACL